MSRLRVLVFSTVFPNPAQPTHGVYVPERLGPLRDACDLRVVAPVAWFRRRGKVPARGTEGGLPVAYPTFFYVPGILRGLNGVFLFASSARAVAALRRERDFDVVDAHFTYPDGFAAALIALWLKKPLVITEHGTLAALASIRRRRPALAWALRRAARVIAVSGELAREAVALGAGEDRVAVIENGVDTRRFAPRDRREARRQLGLPEEGPILVSVGHLSRRKGHHRVIDVLPEVIREAPGVRYAVIGGASPEGDTGPALREQARRLGVERHVVWAGVVPPDEVARWLGAADVFVLSSDFEGCPCSVYEAMAAGLPVVSTRVGEVERMVPEGMGILVGVDDREGLRDAIVRALGRAWDTDAIRTYAEGKSWEGGARRILEAWRAAAGSGT
jgi:glycosyltransferase involved in cell wall biosynthesis